MVYASFHTGLSGFSGRSLFPFSKITVLYESHIVICTQRPLFHAEVQTKTESMTNAVLFWQGIALRALLLYLDLRGTIIWSIHLLLYLEQWIWALLGMQGTLATGHTFGGMCLRIQWSWRMATENRSSARHHMPKQIHIKHLSTEDYECFLLYRCCLLLT